MRCVAVFLLCAAGALCGVSTSRAQGWWWQHERLQTGMYAVSSDPSEVYINSRGDVCYYAASSPYDYFDAYRNRENLSEWLGPDRAARTRGINERGQVLYEAIHRAPWGGQMLSLFVDRRNWTENLVRPGMSYDFYTFPSPGQRRLDDSGRPVFKFTAEYPNGRQVLYHGDRAISEEVLSGHTYISGACVNSNGAVAWDGKGVEFGGTQVTFVDTRPLSYEVLGPGYGTGALEINERGDVLWGGVDIDGYSDFFINEVNYSRSHFGNVGYNYSAWAKAMNNNADVIWVGTDRRYSVPSPDVYRNRENLSVAAIGDVPRSVEPYGISESGVAVWTGNNWVDWVEDVYKDTTNLTAPLFRPQFGRGYVVGDNVRVDAVGRALYSVRTAVWGDLRRRVFVDDSDMSLDALGEEVGNYYCTPVEIGPNGHVFWVAWDMRTGLADVYLSTPVPEPSAALVLPVAIGLLSLHRRRRAH